MDKGKPKFIHHIDDWDIKLGSNVASRVTGKIRDLIEVYLFATSEVSDNVVMTKGYMEAIDTGFPNKVFIITDLIDEPNSLNYYGTILTKTNLGTISQVRREDGIIVITYLTGLPELDKGIYEEMKSLKEVLKDK